MSPLGNQTARAAALDIRPPFHRTRNAIAFFLKTRIGRSFGKCRLTIKYWRQPVRKAHFTLLFAVSALLLSALAQSSAHASPTGSEVLQQCENTDQMGRYNLVACYVQHMEAGLAALKQQNWNKVVTEETDAVALLVSYQSELSTRLGSHPIVLAAPYLARAAADAKRGQDDLAISDSTTAVALDPHDPLPLTNRCSLHAIFGDLPDALQDCNQAQEIAPNTVYPLDASGFVDLKMKNYPAAVTNYEASLKLRPNHASSLYGLGLAEQAQENQPLGDQHIAAAERIDPKISTDFVPSP